MHNPAVASSRIALDPGGVLVVIVTTPAPDVRLGQTYRVLGNTVLATLVGEERMFGFLGERGRQATPQERVEAKPAYETPKTVAMWVKRAEPDEDELDDTEALHQCRHEQQRDPQCLLDAA
jgi:hypothetical protein